MTKFRSHAVRFPTASFFRPLLQLTPLDVEQVAAQQHQVSLTEYYDILLAHEPPPPSEPTNNPALNVSLHRLNRALQAALQSIGGDVPEETPSTPEGADASAEAESLHQPPATEPQPQQTNVSDQLDTDSGVIQSPQLLTATDEHSEPEPEPEPEPSTQSSPLGPTLSPTNAVSAVDTTATSTATCEDDDSAGATASTTEPPLSSPVEPKPDPDPAPEAEQGPEPDPEPEPEPDVEPPAPEVDWAEARELEIARLGSENARLRALLGIDPASLTAAGIPDIDPEPPSMATLFLHHAAQSSSAWANGGAESSNPFTAGFREDPSVLGLAATPSRLHTLTPPNAPHHATDAAAGDTTARAGHWPIAPRACLSVPHGVLLLPPLQLQLLVMETVTAMVVVVMALALVCLDRAQWRRRFNNNKNRNRHLEFQALVARSCKAPEVVPVLGAGGVCYLGDVGGV
jgi:hypothetical protein